MNQVLKAVQEALNDDISAGNDYSARDYFKFVGQASVTTFYKDENGTMYSVRVVVEEIV